MTDIYVELAKRQRDEERIKQLVNDMLDEREQQKLALARSNANQHKPGPTKQDLSPYADLKLRSMKLGEVITEVENATGLDVVGAT